jgi:peroxiredoxin
MMSHRLPLIVAVAALLLSAGCEKCAPAVPRIDAGRSDAYAAAAFKDDAPANASLGRGDFPLAFVDADGQPVDLAQYRGQKKVVLVVLRGMPQSPGGVFCPSCLAQTGSLLANRRQFADQEAEVLVVFPGPAERLGEFVRTARERTPGEPDRWFQVLLDRECRACERLGIRDDLAKPSTYILDTRGNLVYAYVGETSTDRPSVKALLAQLAKVR